MGVKIDFDASRLTLKGETEQLTPGRIFRDLEKGNIYIYCDKWSIVLSVNNAEICAIPEAMLLYEEAILKPDYESAKIVNGDKLVAGCLFIPIKNKDVVNLLCFCKDSIFCHNDMLYSVDLCSFNKEEIYAIDAHGFLITSWKIVLPSEGGDEEKVLFEYSAPGAP